MRTSFPPTETVTVNSFLCVLLEYVFIFETTDVMYL